MERTLYEKFYLLSLNPKNGYYVNAGNFLKFGLVGSIVFELYLQEIISIPNKQVKLAYAASIQPQYFQEIIVPILQKRNTKVNVVLSRLGMKFNGIKKKIVAGLIERDLIVEVQKRFLGIPYKRFYTKNNLVRSDEIRYLRDILLRDKTPNRQDLFLLLLVKHGYLVRALSDRRDEKRRMRKRLNELLKQIEQFAPDFMEIKELGKSLQIIINSSNAAVVV